MALTHAQLFLQVSARLAELGWTPLHSVAIASKFYDTAVGPKEALLYLTKGDGYYYTLYGTYYSEGRNALSCGQLIPCAVEAGDVQAYVDKFAAQADAAVAETYAARLLRLAA